MALLAWLFFCMALSADVPATCTAPTTVKEAAAAEVRAFFRSRHMTVLTFLGYSAAEYEHKDAMIEQATRILEQFDPARTIVNIGATADGIGAVYEVARRKGFVTAGIVSTQARESQTALSPCVDIVFFVKDATWGGFLDGTQRLSPTSTAMVETSDRIVAIGGGEVARDELMAARRLGKRTRFIPADMNHAIARDKAQKKGQPAPTDFAGAAATAFTRSKAR